MLELPIMSQTRGIHLADSRVILLTRVPYPLHSLDDSDVIGLKLVKTNGDNKSGYVQCPHAGSSQSWMFVNRDIIDDDRLKSCMRVHNDGKDQGSIQHGADRPGSKRYNRQWH